MLPAECNGLVFDLDGSVYADVWELRLAVFGDSPVISLAQARRAGRGSRHHHIDDHHAICTVLRPSGGPFGAGVLDGRRIYLTRLLERY